VFSQHFLDPSEYSDDPDALST